MSFNIPMAQTAGQAIVQEEGIKRLSGTLSLQQTSLIFKDSAGKSIIFSLEKLDISRGGANNRYIYFKHPDFPGTSFYTDDFAFLKQFTNIVIPGITVEAKKMLKSEKKNKAIFYFALGFLPALIVLLYIFRGPVAGMIVTAIPTSMDVQVGKMVDESVKTQFKCVSDEQVDKIVAKLSQPLIEKAKASFQHPFTIKVVENSEINAFAAPGGYIYLHTGLLEKAETPLQVQGVIAHEIAHVVKRHTMKSLTQNIGVYAAFTVFLGDISGFVAMGASLLQLQFSREHEVEADTYGRDLMLSANLDPVGMTEFFEILIKREDEIKSERMGDVEKYLAILSTHPQTEARVKMLKELDEKMERSDFTETMNVEQWQEFQKLLKEKF